MSTTRMSIRELEVYIQECLEQAGAGTVIAAATARFLAKAEAQGLTSHGLARLKQYSQHLSNGRADGAAEPVVVKDHAACALVDAGNNLAYYACEIAVELVGRKGREYGIGLVGVTNSHHFGVAGLHVEALAHQGLIGVALSNSPAAMPAWGGKQAVFGTNPIAVAFPRKNHAPLVIDLSLSQVARGKLMVAAQQGKSIPLGWALDKEGNPTEDPQAGLEGTMCPAGGVKGAMLALIVELLCVGLTNAAFAFEADSFFVAEGNQPCLGHCFMAINPAAMGGSDVFDERLELLLAVMRQDEGVRLPGELRHVTQTKAQQEGVVVSL